MTSSSDTPGVTAYVGATIIDGNGASPIQNGVLLTENSRICAVGSRREVTVPSDATVVDIAGRYLLPGFMDGNVHLVPWPSWTYIEFLARYEHDFESVIAEGAQIALSHGFTTLFDSMGPLDSLMNVRDAINAGTTEGSRLYVAGNIVGFRAVFISPGSMGSASLAFQKRINDRFETLGGPDLSWKSPEQIYEQITRYVAQGVDFVKYGATGDGQPVNSEVGQAAVLRFSPDQQVAIIRAAHDAGVIVQTHTASAEAIHLAVALGNDMGQHAGLTGSSRMYQKTIDLMLETGFHCGTQWAPLTPEQLRIVHNRDFVGDDSRNGDPTMDYWLENDIRLIEAGVPQLLTTDAGTVDPDVAQDEHQWGGLGGLASHIGEAGFRNMRAMSQRGMNPMQIIQAATKNVADAYNLTDVGTLEVGNIADLVILGADPMADVENMRQVITVVKEGKRVDTASLPTRPTLTAASATEPGHIRKPQI